MIAKSASDVEAMPVASLQYRGVTSQVREVTVRWLSKVGQDADGSPMYGLRLFTIGPDGEIPTHNHGYMQTLYIVSGEFECWAGDPDTGKVETRVCGPGDMVYVSSMEPHGMRNMSSTESGQFLCCICTLDASQMCPG